MGSEVEVVDEPMIGTATWMTPDVVSNAYPFRPGALWLGRNANDDRDPVGRIDDSHVLLCAKTRSAKGRALIVPNLIAWRGSLFCYDPKGENASVTAARRGRGSKHARNSLNQKVCVLDAHEVSNVGPTERAYFNPIAEIAPSDPFAPSKAALIAESCVSKQSRTDTTWDDKAETFIKILVLHVASSKFVPTNQRDMITVRRFIVAGDWIAVQKIKENVSPDELRQNPPDPFRILLAAMAKNDAFGGVIADQAQSYLASMKSQPKLWNSIRTSAEQHTAWIDDPKIRFCLQPGTYSQTFRAADLQRQKGGLSVFLCVPSSMKDTLAAWPRLVVNLIIAAAQEHGNMSPATDHQTLMLLDEFPSLQRMPKIETAAADIAGAGVKLFFVVQSLTQIKSVYGEGWEAFLSSADTHIYYGFNDNFTAEYVSKRLGDIEVVRRMRTGSEAVSRTTAVAEQSGGSSAHAMSQSESSSASSTQGRGGGSGSSRGSSHGDSYTKGWGPSLFLRTLETSHQEGRNSSSNSGKSRHKSWNRSSTTGTSQQTGVTNTDTESWSRTVTETRGDTVTQGWNETLHKKPLAAINELMALFGAVEDPHDPRFPGIGLISTASGLPFLVQKTMYDKDRAFEGKFDPHPKHGFVALPPPDPIYGPEFFKTFGMKETVDGLRINSAPGNSVGDTVRCGDTMAVLWYKGEIVYSLPAPVDVVITNDFYHRNRARIEGEVLQLSGPDDEREAIGQYGLSVIEPEPRHLEVRTAYPVSKKDWASAVRPIIDKANAIVSGLKRGEREASAAALARARAAEKRRSELATEKALFMVGIPHTALLLAAGVGCMVWWWFIGQVEDQNKFISGLLFGFMFWIVTFIPLWFFDKEGGDSAWARIARCFTLLKHGGRWPKSDELAKAEAEYQRTKHML